MKYPEINIQKEKALELDSFRYMDYYAVNNYNLPIELMMENAGLQLANLVASFIEKANSSSAVKVSLDIPTGFLGDINSLYFQADKILTLAAAKKVLYNLNSNTEIYIADIGIPKEVYDKFNVDYLPFHENNIVKLMW